jgi:hypothetical protein
LSYSSKSHNLSKVIYLNPSFSAQIWGWHLASWPGRGSRCMPPTGRWQCGMGPTWQGSDARACPRMGAYTGVDALLASISVREGVDEIFHASRQRWPGGRSFRPSSRPLSTTRKIHLRPSSSPLPMDGRIHLPAIDTIQSRRLGGSTS